MATFPKGIYANKNDKAPDYIICNVKIQKAELIEWMNTQTDNDIRLTVKKSKEGKVYMQVDEYRPAPKTTTEEPPRPEPDKEGLPF